MFPVKEGVSQFMCHCGYTLGIRTICVDADVLTVQNQEEVAEELGISQRAVSYSLEGALKKIRKNF